MHPSWMHQRLIEQSNNDWVLSVAKVLDIEFKRGPSLRLLKHFNNETSSPYLTLAHVVGCLISMTWDPRIQGMSCAP